MNRRALDRTLETLSRSELRTLSADLTSLIGVDAVSRLSEASPFLRAAAQPQLMLAAVDVDLAASRLADVQAAALAAIRATAAADGIRPANAQSSLLAAALGTDALRDAVAAGFDTAIGDACAALRFDFRVGLEFTDALLATDQRLARAAEHMASTWQPPRVPLGDLFATLRARASSTPVDEATFSALLFVCSRGEALGFADAWGPVGAALEGGRNPHALRWVAQALERSVEPTHAVALLRVLSAHATERSVDGFVQAAELHLAIGAVVFELLSETLARNARTSEARFWLGEGRLRYPDVEAWSNLEATLRAS